MFVLQLVYVNKIDKLQKSVIHYFRKKAMSSATTSEDDDMPTCGHVSNKREPSEATASTYIV